MSAAAPLPSLDIGPRQRAYALVAVGALLLQLASAIYNWPRGILLTNITNIVGIGLCLVMLGLIRCCFRIAVIHGLALLLATGWVIVDIINSWPTNQDININLFLEMDILALLAFTFLPVRAANIFVSAAFALLAVATLIHHSQHIITLLLTGFIIVLTGFMSAYGRQIIQVQARNDLLGEIAYRDPLTGLSNRRIADEALATLPGPHQPERIAIMLFDLDHFKRVNDTLGHQAGDQALMHIAGVLRQFVRSTDLLSRWGGEEFLLVWYDIDPSKAQERTEEILQAVRAAPLPGYPPLTLSCGGVMFDEAADKQALLTLADTRLYRAKNQGRNQAVWHDPTSSVADVQESGEG